jgi:hypothetical protein
MAGFFSGRPACGAVDADRRCHCFGRCALHRGQSLHFPIWRYVVGCAYACIRARSRVRVVTGEHAFRPRVAAFIYRDLKSNNQRGPGVPDLTIPFIEIRERKRRKESERMSCRATEHVPPGNSACPVREQAVLMEGLHRADLKNLIKIKDAITRSPTLTGSALVAFPRLACTVLIGTL